MAASLLPLCELTLGLPEPSALPEPSRCRGSCRGHPAPAQRGRRRGPECRESLAASPQPALAPHRGVSPAPRSTGQHPGSPMFLPAWVSAGVFLRSGCAPCSPCPGPFPRSPVTRRGSGSCFCLPRVCTPPCSYRGKQKTSLTSHLFHRGESNSLLNDCPEPTIQKAGIYSACWSWECITVVLLHDGAEICFFPPVSLKRKAIKYD